jgi:hypothetical protein
MMMIQAMLKIAGKELTPEENEAARLRIEAAAKRPYTYNPDCPLLTEKQLSEFRPVNFDSMEERAQYMVSPFYQNSDGPLTTRNPIT